jgi:hypothetical protein
MGTVMKLPLRALASLGVLMAAGALSTAKAQGDSTSNSDTAVSEHDIKTVLTEVNSAWRDFARCEPRKACDIYFESYGVALTFNDGSIVPFAHVQRLGISAHECIANARAALDRGDKALAVQWVMASYLHNDGFRMWLGDHPDTVVAALQRCCDRRQ